MSSSFYVTYGTDRLVFGGTPGSLAWETPASEAQLFTVHSDSDHTLASGTVYDNNGNVITSLTARNGYASTMLNTHAVSACYYQSSDDYYRVSAITALGYDSWATDWQTAKKVGSASSLVTGSSIEIGSKETTTNKFTARGKFVGGIGNSLKGWWVPGYVTAVTGTYGDTTSVSAARTMQYKKMAAGNGTTWTNATTSINALRGVAFSAFSGGANITATGVGKSNLTLMYHGIDLCNQSNWTTNISANKTITTARAKTITSATFTPVTAMQSNGTIGAYAYCHSSYSQGGRTSYYTGEGRVGGTWTATGIAP